MPAVKPLIFALCLEIASLVLLRLALGKRIWAHLGALFVIFAFVYHGLGEVAAHMYPGAPSRYGIAPDSFDTWQYTIGPAILVFTCTYLLTLGRARLIIASPSRATTVAVGRFFNWRYLLILIAPMYLLTLNGKALAISNAPPESSSFYSGFVAQFMVIAIILAAYSYIVEYGPRRFLPVILMVSLSTILIGQRGAITIVIIPLLWALARIGVKPTRRQFVAIVGLVAIGALVISGSRATVGRSGFAENQGTGSRLSTTAAGIQGVLRGQVSATFISDYFDRIDGNNFAAYADASRRRGIGTVGFSTLSNNFFLAVPSFVNPQKLETDILRRNEERAIEAKYLMGPINRLPTTLGVISTYAGGRWLMMFAALFGICFGLADRWLKKETPVRLVFGVGLMLCVASYEAALSVYPIILRGALVLVVVVKAVQVVVPLVRLKAPYRPVTVMADDAHAAAKPQKAVAS